MLFMAAAWSSVDRCVNFQAIWPRPLDQRQVIARSTELACNQHQPARRNKAAAARHLGDSAYMDECDRLKVEIMEAGVSFHLGEVPTGGGVV